jgi:hypothetical protein
MIDEGDDEPQLSTGSRKDLHHQLLGQAGRAEAQGEVGLDLAARKPIESELRA